MKEIIPQKDLKDTLQVVIPVKQEYKHIGSVRKIPGLTLYCYNTVTGDIFPTPLVRHVALNEKGKPTFITKTTYDPKCLYVQALNIKNARKKFQKMIT